MARELDRSTRETEKAKSEATAGPRNGETAKSGASDTVDLLKGQHRELRRRSPNGRTPTQIPRRL